MKPELLYLLIAFFVCMLLAWLFSYILRHKERLRLIDKGINPDEYLNKQGISFGLKIGIVMIGLSIGLATIAILVSLNAFGRSNATPLSILAFSVGGALVVANSINKGNRN